jgi:hypothetical protein
LPLWLRFFLLIGVAVFAAGAGLLAYRYYTRPVTLTVAVGSIDGEAAKAMSAIAGELVSTNAQIPAVACNPSESGPYAIPENRASNLRASGKMVRTVVGN